jgi:dienelactone hydrolase
VLKAHGHHQYGRIENQHRLHWTVQDEAGQRRENRYPDQVAWAAPLFSPPTLAMNLAMQGYVVLSWDMVGYNDTIQTPHTFGGDREKLWSFGPLGLQLWNSIRMLDFISTLDDVDPGRIAMTGASGGGSQTFLLAAVDERVRVAVPVVMVGGIMQGGSACENAPGLRFETYNTELAALTAPRPMFLVGSNVDQSRLNMTEDYPALRAIYALYGKERNVEATVLDAPHNYNRFSREAVYRFLAKHFDNRQEPGPILERAVTVEPPHRLLALHNRTLPPNALSYDEIFAQWIRAAEKQTQSMMADKELLRERLRAAIAATWPKQVSDSSTADGEMVLSRPGRDDRVPSRMLAGRSGQGAVLVVDASGIEKAQGSKTVARLKAAGHAILMIDAFQTGSAMEHRNYSFREGRPERGYYHTFNRSDDANRVQDILTGLAFLHQKGERQIQLVGFGKAAVWGLFAAAIAPIEVALCVDLGQFRGQDEEFIDTLFIPGVQRAGGLAAALKLTERARSACALRE